MAACLPRQRPGPAPPRGPGSLTGTAPPCSEGFTTGERHRLARVCLSLCWLRQVGGMEPRAGSHAAGHAQAARRAGSRDQAPRRGDRGGSLVPVAAQARPGLQTYVPLPTQMARAPCGAELAPGPSPTCADGERPPGRDGAAASGRSVCEPAVAAGPTHRRGCGGRQERRRGQPRGEGGECVLVLVCVLVCVLVLVELRPQQSPRAPRGAGPLGTLDQKARVQLLPEQLAIYERKRERQRGTSAAAPGGARRIVTWHSRLRQATPWWPLATCGPQGGGKRGACDQVPIRIPA